MLKKILLSGVFLLLVTISSFGQPYKTGVGIRFGGIATGVSVRHFVSSKGAFEGLASFGRHAFIITGLYESFHAFPNAEGLSWFFGGGAHVGFHQDEYRYEYYYYKGHGNKTIKVYEDGDEQFSFGGDFIIGLDYKFKNTPIDISLDVKPMIDFVPGLYGYWEGAISFRFTL